jgi:hypothetical protein
MKESEVILEFQEEARVEQGRKHVLDVLQARFGSPGPELTAALNSITDSARLDRLHRLALRCASLEQFRDRFPRREGSRTEGRRPIARRGAFSVRASAAGLLNLSLYGASFGGPPTRGVPGHYFRGFLSEPLN